MSIEFELNLNFDPATMLKMAAGRKRGTSMQMWPSLREESRETWIRTDTGEVLHCSLAVFI